MSVTGGKDSAPAATGPDAFLSDHHYIITVTDPQSDQQTTTLVDPSPERACETIREGIERGALVTVFGRCAVEYDGRASSRLESGDRHVMLKPDGTILIHTIEGHRPVNWQPPGSTYEIECESDRLLLRSERSTPEERLLVRYDSVEQVSRFSMRESGDFDLVGSEADLRDRILDDPDLLEPGFTPLATERKTPAGAIDLYGEDATGRSVVVELKRRRVGPDAVSQLRRYVDALARDLHDEAEIRGILVAPSLTDRGTRLLAQHDLEFVSLEPTDNS